MVSYKTTLLTNIFNEEYLLPFWLNHHKDMFDEIIIIDYNSTDNSIKICKSICPTCKIITTRNQYFEAEEIGKEFMDIENGIEGIKMILNTTEFLFYEKPIREMFLNNTTSLSYAIRPIAPFSLTNYTITNNNELFRSMLNNDVVFNFVDDRGVRQLHNYSNGNYTVGRHYTYNSSISTDEAHIVWLGFYPMNEYLLNRKLQIKQNIPQGDLAKGYSYNHFYDKEKLLAMHIDGVRSGVELKNINKPLYNLINNVYKSITTNNKILKPMNIIDENGIPVKIHLYEVPEQYLAKKLIFADDIVLELGARYGSVSCIINHKLNNKKNQVSVEPDERVWNALEKNKETNNCDFHIVKAFISNKKLGLINIDECSGYAATSEVNDNSSIQNYSLDEIQQMYNIPSFNVLIADCEGFLETFFRENPNFYKSLRLVIFEADYADKCNYDYVKTILKNAGFIALMENFQNVFIRNI